MMKKFLFLLAGMFITLGAVAQDAAQTTKSFWTDPFNDPMLPLYTVTAFIFIVIVLVLAVALYLIRILNMMTDEAAREKAQRLGLTYTPQPTWIDSLWQKMNDSVPLQKEADIDLGHSYDGIRELDNHLPPWWKWLFYGTIGWSAVYLVVYHITDNLPLQSQEYQNEVALADEQVKKFKASQPQATVDENALTFTNDAALIEHGKKVFMDNSCGTCHRNDGGGNTIGPNLADSYWIHGGEIKNIFSTIKNGAVEKGMPAWGKTMSATDVRDVTFYVLSLQGSNPPNPKAPQGQLFEQKPAATDTTKADLSKAQASL